MVHLSQTKRLPIKTWNRPCIINKEPFAMYWAARSQGSAFEKASLTAIKTRSSQELDTLATHLRQMLPDANRHECSCLEIPDCSSLTIWGREYTIDQMSYLTQEELLPLQQAGSLTTMLVWDARELMLNLALSGGGGIILISRLLQTSGLSAIELASLDEGSGINDLAKILANEYDAQSPMDGTDPFATPTSRGILRLFNNPTNFELYSKGIRWTKENKKNCVWDWRNSKWLTTKQVTAVKSESPLNHNGSFFRLVYEP